MSSKQINGSVLRTLNVLSGECSLSGIEYVFGGGNRFDRGSLLDSIDYLSESEYIALKNHMTGRRIPLETERFAETDAALTNKGISILRGVINDECVEV